MNLRHLLIRANAWLLLAGTGLLAAALRYGLIEPAALAQRCEDTSAPAWCWLRTLAVQAFLSYAYGYAALASAAVALCWQCSVTAWLTAALGLVALIMYCPEAGALSLLVGCLLLVRSQSQTAHG